jgi:hypothetical protein
MIITAASSRPLIAVSHREISVAINPVHPLYGSWLSS